MSVSTGEEEAGVRTGTSHAVRSERTRQAILTAAAGEFIAHGLEGANMEAIASAAGVNKALVYRHFSRKETLFRHVLEAAYRAMRQAEQALDLPQDPVAALDRVTAFTFDYYQNNPGFLTLVGIENLHGGMNLRDSTAEAVDAGTITRMMAAILDRGRAAGVFRDGLDPVEVWLSISGLCWATIATVHTIRFTFARDVLAEPERSQRLQHIQEMLRRYVVK
jgi:AcrR family transcriptional regulator